MITLYYTLIVYMHYIKYIIIIKILSILINRVFVRIRSKLALILVIDISIDTPSNCIPNNFHFIPNVISHLVHDIINFRYPLIDCLLCIFGVLCSHFLFLKSLLMTLFTLYVLRREFVLELF